MQIFELAPKIQSLDWNSDYWARGLANTQLTSQGAPSHFVLHFWWIFFPQWFLCWRSWRDLSKSSGRCQLRRNILFQALRAVTAAAELWEQAVFLCITTKLWLAHSVPTLTFVEILHIAYVKVIWNRLKHATVTFCSAPLGEHWMKSLSCTTTIAFPFKVTCNFQLEK